VALCGYSRKHAIGLLNGRGRPRLLKRSGPKPLLSTEASAAGARADLVWERSAFAGNDSKRHCQSGCPNYEKEYGALALPLKEKLANISAATIDRLLSPMRAKARPKGRGGTSLADG